MNLSNAAHLDLTINNPLILGDLIQRLMENTKDCKDISVTPTCQLSHRLLHIRIDGQRPTQTLAACGIKLCEIYGTTLILVEEGLSGKYHIYPIDTYHIPSNVSLVNLSFVEKVKVYAQVLKQYRVKVKFSLESMGNLKFFKDSRVRFGSSILQTEDMKLPHQAFFHINVDDHEFGHMYQNKVEPLQPKASETQVTSIVGETKVEQPFWNEKTRPDPLLEGNRTFDTRGTPFKTHDPRQSRTYVGGFESKVDPIRGDDFSNRSFDKDFDGDELTFGNNDPFGHDQQYRKADINPSPEHIHHGESASFNLETNANVKANAQSGEAVQVELETDAARDETYALSAHHIDEALFDVNLGGMKVSFDGHDLFFMVSTKYLGKTNICGFELNLKDVEHLKFAQYIVTGGAQNLESKLKDAHGLNCPINTTIQDDLIAVEIETIHAKTFSKAYNLFNGMIERVKLPRDAQGNVLDVHLEESKVLPKVDGESKAIRITDDKLFIVIGNSEFEETVIQSGDSYFISTKLAKDWNEATLKMLAVTLKANYGGKAKGDIQLSRDEGGLAIVLGKKPRFQKLREMLDKVIANQDVNKTA